MAKRAYDNSKRAELRERTRTAIIQAMITAMADGGDDVSVADVARMSGVSLRTVYQHFPDKAARIEAINDWVDQQVDTRDVLVRDFSDIGGYVERVVDYVLENEQIVKAQLAPGLSKSVRTYRKRIHARRLRKALKERIASDSDVDELTALIVSCVRAEAILDMRDLYGLSAARIKFQLRGMVEAALASRTGQAAHNGTD